MGHHRNTSWIVTRFTQYRLFLNAAVPPLKESIGNYFFLFVILLHTVSNRQIQSLKYVSSIDGLHVTSLLAGGHFNLFSPKIANTVVWNARCKRYAWAARSPRWQLMWRQCIPRIAKRSSLASLTPRRSRLTRVSQTTRRNDFWR